MMPTLQPSAWLWKGITTKVQVPEPTNLMNTFWTPLYTSEDIASTFREGVASGVKAERARSERLLERTQ